MVPLHIQLASSTLRKVIKRLHYPLEIMLVCARWYAAYPLSLRNLEEMMAERGVIVDHATVHRWALKILPVLAMVVRSRKRAVGSSWRVDETYIKVGGQWKYLYRAVDRLGQTVDFLLTAHRDVAAARRFFERAIDRHRAAHARFQGLRLCTPTDRGNRDDAHDQEGATRLPQRPSPVRC